LPIFAKRSSREQAGRHGPFRSVATGARTAAIRARPSAALELIRSHPRHVGLAALVVGIGGPGALEVPLPAEAVALAAAALLAGCALAGTPRLGLACGALVAVGAALGTARLADIDADRLALAGSRLEARAVLLEHPRPSPFGWAAEVQVFDGGATGPRLLARTPEDVPWPANADIGTELEITGFAHPVHPRPGAEVDWAAYLEHQGIAGELEVEAVSLTGARRGGLIGAIDRARARAEGALEAGVSEPNAALIRGMVLGQDEAIDPLVRDDFRASGLAHILAVSGQNVVLLGLLALPALAAVRAPPRARLAILIALIAAYVPLAGAGPSLQRAGVMGAAGLIALAVGRPASRWYALLLAAAVTLALNPRVCGDAGWQLSFAAVTGILVLGGTVRAALAGLPHLVADGVALTVCATVATAPLLAHHFGQVSVASLPANLLALPAVAPAMWLGMAQMAIAQLGDTAGPLAGAATAGVGALGTVNEVLLDYLSALAAWFAEPSWAQVEVGLASPVLVVVAYAAIGAAALGARPLSRRAGPPASALLARLRTAPTRTRRALAIALVAAFAALVASVTGPGDPPEELTVSFLDVGQGDATLVQHPDGGSILIDGGPAEARAYRLLSEAGVERLDLVIATHASADHHGGLVEVLEHIPVDVLLDGGDGTADPEFRAMLAEAERRGVRTMAASAGQTLAVGELTVKVLSPEPRPPGPAPEDPNPRAVTAVVSADEFELLASGDAESPSLAPLGVPDVDLLKVPHHGSADEGLAEVLDRARPEVAGIGVGEDNTYGHPAPSTLEALREAGTTVYRTDLDGTITVTVAGGEMEVATDR